MIKTHEIDCKFWGPPDDPTRCDCGASSKVYESMTKKELLGVVRSLRDARENSAGWQAMCAAHEGTIRRLTKELNLLRKYCGCTSEVPCLAHVDARIEELMRTPEFLAAELSQVQSDVDMAGPDDDVSCPDHWHCDPDRAAHMCWLVDRSRECPTCKMPPRDPWKCTSGYKESW